MRFAVCVLAVSLVSTVFGLAIPYYPSTALLEVDTKVPVEISAFVRTVEVPVGEDEFFDDTVDPNAATDFDLDQLVEALSKKVKKCTVCTDDKYTATPCTRTSDTVCSECGTRVDGQYIKTPCDFGTIDQVGAPTQFDKCTEPGQGEYVLIKCGDADTTIASCTKAAEKQYYSTVCDPGNSLQTGIDSIPADCSQPPLNHFVAVACGETSDTQSTPCSEPIDGEYYISQCETGDVLKAGSDAVLGKCTEPIDGQWAKSSCGGTSDTDIQPCSIPKDGEYAQKPCVSGASNSVGEDATILACTKPEGGNYVEAACTSISDTVISPCTPVGEAQYIAEECSIGSIYEPGRDTVSLDCTKPEVDSGVFVVNPCGLTQDTETEACKVAATGEYIQTACVTGDWKNAGQNSVVSPCTPPPDGHHVTQACGEADTKFEPCSEAGFGEYIKTPCQKGSISEVGQDADVQPCTPPGQDEYVSAACTDDADTIRTACSLPGAGEFIRQDCDRGDIKTPGSDNVFEACAKPDDSQYVTSVCQLRENTGLASCSVAKDGQWYHKKCIQGTIDAPGHDAEVRTCTEPTDLHWVSAGCGGESDTVIEKCATAGAHQYVDTACVKGNSQEPGSNTVIKDCTKAEAGSYYEKQCTATEDAVVKLCSEPQDGQYTVAVCTTKTNTEIADCRKHSETHYIRTPCEKGSSTKPGSNAILATCSTPSSHQYVSKPCSEFENAVLAACSTCKASQIVVSACSHDADTVCKEIPGYLKTATVTSTTSSQDFPNCDAPVVIASYSANNKDAYTLRLKSTGKNSVESHLQNACNNAPASDPETADLLVLDPGSYNNYVVGTATIGSSFKDVTFGESLGKYPLVFPFIQSSNNERFAIVRQTPSGSDSSTQLLVHTDEKTGKTTAKDETVGYIAIRSDCSTRPAREDNEGPRCGVQAVIDKKAKLRSGTIVIGGESFKYELGLMFSLKGTHMQNTYVFASGFFSSVPHVFTSILTINGGDPCFSRIASKNPERVVFTIEEEKCKDEEVEHVSEWVAILAIGN